jgi:hypothetical protein
MKPPLCFTFLALGWLVGCAHSAIKPVRVKPSEIRVTTNPVEVKRCAFVRTVLPGPQVPYAFEQFPMSVADREELRKKASDAGGDTVLAIVDNLMVSGDVYICRK